MSDQQFSDQPAHKRSLSLRLSLKYSMTVKLLTEHHLEFLSLKGGCTGSSESTLANCHIVGNHVAAQLTLNLRPELSPYCAGYFLCMTHPKFDLNNLQGHVYHFPADSRFILS